MNMVNLRINDIPVSVKVGSTILEAARELDIKIPTLCYLKDINAIGACRMCVVEVKGVRNLATACVYPVTEGMEVSTNTERIFKSRKTNLELVLSTHNRRCLSCVRSGDCELQRLCKEYGIEDETYYRGENIKHIYDESSTHMVRDNSRCIVCRRCVAACSKSQAVAVIGANERGFNTHIGCAFDAGLGEVECISCGQCIIVCPVGAIYEKDDTDKVWAALNDPKKHVVVQTAPSIRAALGEEFGMPIGTNVEGKMVAALRRMGFKNIFDTDVSADFTIMEEATEFIYRFTNNKTLPLITSCSPGWVEYCESFYPEFIPNLSSCKSPQQMLGALIKTYYAKEKGIDPKDIYMVTIMPCTAKKFEVKRTESNAVEGVFDCDVSITTRELARMIKRAGINFTSLEDEPFDNPFGESTGAGDIFGRTGGVMEAALRTAVEWVSGSPVEKLEFEEIRGTQGIKKATYKVGEHEINVAVVSGLVNASKILEDIKAGKNDFHFIEVMACAGGCVNGGGQPIQPAEVRETVDIRSLRASALNNQDKSKKLRRSHESPFVKKVYKEFLGEPGGEVAHHILHTHYTKRERY